VNLIGDHTDYQDGWCLPMAIDRDIAVRFGPAETAPATGDPFVRAVCDRFPSARFDIATTSTLPAASGLSSSAAYSIALLLAASYSAGAPLAGRDLALAAQAVEHQASGVPCGVMDQMASVFGRAGHALLLDCRSLGVDAVPMPAGADALVVHSDVRRRLAGSEYAARRAACEAAAARLGVAALRDATLDQVADDPIARHVVSENARVLAFVDALRANDLGRCGALMDESHASLRDDFGVSIPELDALVRHLNGAGAFGARLTGAGFGGCVVALVPVDRTAAITAALHNPHWVVKASEGASVS
jgi:galactokinase